MNDEDLNHSTRRPTLRGRLVRLGFADSAKACGLLSDPDLARATRSVDGPTGTLLDAVGLAADPDLALLQLVRLAGADSAALAPVLADEAAKRRLIAVLGASTALGDEIVRRPQTLGIVADPASGLGIDPALVRAELLNAVGARPGDAAPRAAGDPAESIGALRRAYRDRLLRIAASDLTAEDPLSHLPDVAAALADLAAAALDAALAVARGSEPDADDARLAVIGMGKCGGRELNYVSDVDVIYVAEPAPGAGEEHALAVATRLAATLTRVCAGVGSEPPLWQVDAALRPEGKQGPLVRTLASHVDYYERWAKTWEFQALLKARTVAGDRALGAAYEQAIRPFVWSAAGRENFVEDAQAMRRRVEGNVPPAQAEQQIKLGKGGLRDVEFTVQLLQLVHGRTDHTIRSANTLTALTELAAGGYVGREHAGELAECYRFLRSLEHRIQLHRLRRTHLMPTAEGALRSLARAMGLPADPDGLAERYRATRRRVRALHEVIFYRPLLPATAQLSSEELSLAPDAARARFAAIGYRDPDGAMRHVTALTEGVSRRAAIQRQLLPVMLGWFAQGADPDAGLLAFRTLSDELGRTPWYLKLLRDSGTAARRLAKLLANSRYVAEAMSRSPESVQWLADDSELAPRGAARLLAEVEAILHRAAEPEATAVTVRAVRRRELARTGVAEVLGVLDPNRAARAVSDAADAVLVGELRLAEAVVRGELGLGDADRAPATMLVVAMGRLGGQEMGYGSDADVLFAYVPTPGMESLAGRYALSVATTLRRLTTQVCAEPALAVDADLRPEGRNGPLVRSLDSYAEYYSRWSSVWESQALLRARPVAGDRELGKMFTDLVDPLRYPSAGLAPSDLREIRRIKARVESERLPRGTDPTRHLKLGRGGVSDVEWLVQLIQLQNAGQVEALRTTSTSAALAAARDAALIDEDDARILDEAWRLGSRLRSALVLWSGRVNGKSVDVLPHDRMALNGLARLLADDRAPTGADLEELYLRTARRARTVMQRLFYG